MKRLIAIAVGVAGLVAAPGVASAHIPNVSDNCQGLNVAFTNYEGGSSNNQVVVTIDGAAQTFTFGASFTKQFAWSTSTAHTWAVVIDANRLNGNPTQYDRSFNGTEQPCTTTTTSISTTTTTTSAPTTTTEPPTTTSTAPTSSSSPSTTTPETTSTVEVGEPPVPSSTPPTPPAPPTPPPASPATNPILPVTGSPAETTFGIAIVLVCLGTFGCLIAHTTRRP